MTRPKIFEETMSSRETMRDNMSKKSQEGASEYGHAMRGNAVMSKFNYTTVVKVDKILASENYFDQREEEINANTQLPLLSSPMQPKSKYDKRMNPVG